MPLVRILVDGYSLLHDWPELAAGRSRHSAPARDALIRVLTDYQDACGTPITVFFDGKGAPPGTPSPHSSREMEVIFSRGQKTADEMIERTAHLLRPYGEVLVITNDHTERDIVIGLGCQAMSCLTFRRTMESEFGELSSHLEKHNRRERLQFRQPQ